MTDFQINGNPLQCSCLENPRDGGVWRAAIYGIAHESDTNEATQQQQQQISPSLFYLPDLIKFSYKKKSLHKGQKYLEGESVSCPVIPNSLGPHELQPARFLCSGNSPDKNIGVGCHSLLQGIFSTQGLNLGLPCCRQILSYLNCQGSPEIPRVVSNSLTAADRWRSKAALEMKANPWG